MSLEQAYNRFTFSSDFTAIRAIVFSFSISLEVRLFTYFRFSPSNICLITLTLFILAAFSRISLTWYLASRMLRFLFVSLASRRLWFKFFIPFIASFSLQLKYLHIEVWNSSFLKESEIARSPARNSILVPSLCFSNFFILISLKSRVDVGWSPQQALISKSPIFTILISSSVFGRARLRDNFLSSALVGTKDSTGRASL